MKRKSLLAMLLAVAMLLSCVGAVAEGMPEKLELKIYVPGDRPRDMDLVLEEIERLCPPEINVKPNLVFIPWSDLADKTSLALTSGEEVDLIFDAPWLHMDQMYSQGMYQILDEYCEQYGQNLISARGEVMWNANKWDGHTIGIPFGDTYGGSRSFYVRKDIREALGIAPLQTHQDLVDFLYAVKENYPIFFYHL